MNITVIGLGLLLLIATFVGWFFTHTKKVDKPVKVMLFVLYFWITTFIQLMIFALLYQFGLLDLMI
jgi:Ca2+/Na+ antiporter